MLSLIFPSRCIGCEAWLETDSLEICSDCHGQLNFLQTPAHLPHLERAYLDAAHSVLAYEGRVLDWVHQFKYQRKFYVGKNLSALLAGHAAADDAWNAIVPVPLHWRRRIRRGFNPAHFLAEPLSRRHRIPLWHALKKRRATKPQTSLSQKERLTNVQGVFALAGGFDTRIKGKRLLLIDDVLTTGSTVNACAKILKQAGAEQVVVLTLARAL